MRLIGLTGGIGSGKTTVARIFSMFDIPVYNSDEAGRKITDQNALVKNAIKKQFGYEIYGEADTLNREKLSEIVFKDADALIRLNAIVHPAVAEDFKLWCEKQNASFVIKETAILFEHGLDKQLDGVIVVEAPDDLRIKRVIKRSGVSEENVRQRINKQLPQNDLILKADWVIHNNELQLLIPQVLEVYSRIAS